MGLLFIFRIWLIKKLAKDAGIILNLKDVSFKPKYEGQPIYGEGLKLRQHYEEEIIRPEKGNW